MNLKRGVRGCAAKIHVDIRILHPCSFCCGGRPSQVCSPLLAPPQPSAGPQGDASAKRSGVMQPGDDPAGDKPAGDESEGEPPAGLPARQVA